MGKNRARGFRLLSGAAGAFLLAGAAAATTVQKLDVAGLTRLATNVVVGRVEGAEQATTPDGGLIVTSTSVTVAAHWKGTTDSASLVVQTPGGRIGNFAMEVPGSPSLRQGDTVLLFLERNPDGTFGVISLAQGSFRVIAGPRGTLFVERDPEARHLIAVEGRASGPVEAVKGSLVAIQADVEKGKRAKPAEEGAVEEGETIVPLVEMGNGGGR
ncbi:MAG: hypothetical protein L0323_16190 [Planctomycetes bacterium]|nr:hypothetical protein [Planctomycetota bacterium]